MRVLWGLVVTVLVLLAAGTAPAAPSDGCGSEYLRLDDQPDWSPDGSELAFVRRHVFDCENGGTMFSVEVTAADGSAGRSLFTTPDAVLSVLWSPEGRRLAAVELTRDADFVRVVDARDAHEIRRITLPTCCGDRGAWSPDGTKIALGSTVVDVTTGVVYAAGIATIGVPSWSPDSRRIAYLAGDGLEVANADGSGRRWIGPGGATSGTVYWSPNGAWIAYEITREFRFVRPDGSGFYEMPDEGLLLGWRPDSQAVLDYVPEDERLITIDKDDGSAQPVGSSKVVPLAFSWARGASVYVDTDLCPRPGIFVQPAARAARRVTNDCVIRGTARADRLTGTSLPDVILGGGGNDKLYGLGGDDVLYGGRGNDVLSGGTGSDIAFGDAGNDMISAETVTGGSGHDTLVVGSDPEWPAQAVNARDGQRDTVRCPLGQWPGPWIRADRFDRIASRCYGT